MPASAIINLRSHVSNGLPPYVCWELLLEISVQEDGYQRKILKEENLALLSLP